jgi:hypothetical protein
MATITEITQYVPEFTNFGQRMFVSAGRPTDTTGVSIGDVCFSQASGVMYAFKDGAWYQSNALYDVTDIQELSGPGAINVTSAVTLLTTTGADAFTLAAGATFGQVKTIILVQDGGDATITPASLSGGTTITLSAAGESVQLLYAGGWIALGGNGFVIA